MGCSCADMQFTFFDMWQRFSRVNVQATKLHCHHTALVSLKYTVFHYCCWFAPQQLRHCLCKEA